jgi:hypothetical protein
MPDLAATSAADAPAPAFVHQDAEEIVFRRLERRELDEGVDEQAFARVRELHARLAAGTPLTGQQARLFKRVGRDRLEDILLEIEDMAKA